jgi:hypothetical protein
VLRTLKVKEGTHTEGVSEQVAENVRTEEKSRDRIGENCIMRSYKPVL